MNELTLGICCFLFFALCTLSMADAVSRSFTMDPLLTNKVSNNNLMAEHHSESFSVCSAMCGEHCACFGFNPQLKKCRLHQSCDSSEMTANEAGWRYFCPDGEMAVDCRELHQKGHNQSGVYKIHPTGKQCHEIRVYCDMVTSGGGWTAIQRQSTGSVNFSRTWNDYKFGFGIPEDYWMGNEAIHDLTKGGDSSLYISITLHNGTTLHELYEQFYLTDETDKYRLVVKGPATGTLGDRWRTGADHHISDGSPFSTRDQDNDSWWDHCAIAYGGGWWFNACSTTFLNGPFTSTGIHWLDVISDGSKVKETLMMIKPR